MSRLSHHHPDDEDGWAAQPRHVDVPAVPVRCKCSHAKSLHYRDRKGRPTCGSAVCGCIEFREDNS